MQKAQLPEQEETRKITCVPYLQVEFVGRAVSDADRAELAKAVLAATKKNPKSLAPP